MEGEINADELPNYLVKALPTNEASGAHCPKGLLCSALQTHPMAGISVNCGSQFSAFTPSLVCEFGHSTEPFSRSILRSLKWRIGSVS